LCIFGRINHIPISNIIIFTKNNWTNQTQNQMKEIYQWIPIYQDLFSRMIMKENNSKILFSEDILQSQWTETNPEAELQNNKKDMGKTRSSFLDRFFHILFVVFPNPKTIQIYFLVVKRTYSQKMEEVFSIYLKDDSKFVG